MGEYEDGLRREPDSRWIEDARVNRIRGFVMLLASAVAAWKGWQIHHGERAMMAYALAALALAVGVWHLTRKAPLPRV
jgi:membrane protein YdbS with pleckstrin-like domain